MKNKFLVGIKFPWVYNKGTWEDVLLKTLLVISFIFSPLMASAQAEDETYNPFADYSEFEESGEEEADLHFFRNGRFLTLGFMMGQTRATSSLSKAYSPGLGYGLFLSYFFDLRLAMQFSYFNSSHDLSLKAIDGTTANASAKYSTLNIDFKYFLNTQNVTRGLADLNPYILAGMNQTSKTASSQNSLEIAKQNASGFNIGAGVEFPILRKEMFIGFQAVYNLVQFPDENTEIFLGSSPTGVKPNGDLLSFQLTLGSNF